VSCAGLGHSVRRYFLDTRRSTRVT
jgi:hypothetical protein